MRLSYLSQWEEIKIIELEQKQCILEVHSEASTIDKAVKNVILQYSTAVGMRQNKWNLFY